MKKSRKHLIYLSAFCLLLGIAGIPSEEPKEADGKDPIVISGRTSSTEIFIGDQFTYELQVEYDKGYSVLQVEPPLELGRFEILEVKPASQGEGKGNRFSKTYAFTLSTYETGDFEIPPFSVTYTLPSGEQKKAQTQPIKMKVKALLHTAEDTHDVRDIKKPLFIPPKPYLRNLLIGTIAGILLIGTFVYVLKRYIITKRTQKPEEEMPLRPIDELALEELETLERSPLLAEGKIKEYYTRAADIIRIYLGRRFHINAIDMTSFEMLRALEDKDIQEPVQKLMEDFLEICDLVKFAKHRPQNPDHGIILEKARLIVHETTPKPIIKPEEPETGNEKDTTPDQDKEKPAFAQADKGGRET